MPPRIRRCMSFRRRARFLAATCALLSFLAGCSGAANGHQPVDAAPPPLAVGQVLATATGRPVLIEPWLDELTSADVIYLGEEHHNRAHIDSALTILRSLVARNRTPTLALEMFAWDGQPALERYLADRQFPTETFLIEAGWEQNWGGPFSDYAPLLTFAREQRVSVLALNPPRMLVRQVAKTGLARALPDPEMARWGMQGESFVDDPAYRDAIIGPLRRCHGGMPDDGYERMYEASLFRDEGMARTIAAALRSAQVRRPIVSYTGGGHVQHRVPVPNRVARRMEPDRTVRQITIYLAAFEPNRPETVHELVKEAIADYVWLTPLSAHGPPRRCK